MKRTVLISLSLLMLLSACKKKDAEQPTDNTPSGKNLLNQLVSYETCKTSLLKSPEEAKTINKKISSLKSNADLAKITAAVDTECTEHERKNLYERNSCGEKACKALATKPADFDKHINEQCPEIAKVPPWSKKCADVYLKVGPHFKIAG